MHGVRDARADAPSPFDKMLGRWVGDGRFGTRGGETETVSCRVTYRIGGTPNELKQSVRCASKSGSIEATADIIHASGILSGTWIETTRNWSGSLTGSFTPKGFKVAIKGDAISAKMDVITTDTRQIIEMNFTDSSIIGLTLVLAKG